MKNKTFVQNNWQRTKIDNEVNQYWSIRIAEKQLLWMEIQGFTTMNKEKLER